MALSLWKKMVGLNRFELCFVKHRVDLVYFVSPTVAANDLEELNYITTLWDLCHRDDPAETARADALYQALLDDMRAGGYQQYRASLLAWDSLYQDAPMLKLLNHRIKVALDPQNVLAPGRYGIG